VIACVSGQSYVPQPPRLTAAACRADQTFVSVGNLDSSNSTLFPNNAQGTQLGTYWNPYYQYVYTTPFTNTQFGAVLTQVAMNLLDNSGLPGPVYLRLAIYLFQIAEKKTMGFNEATLIGQTDEITLYPSGDQILYANLMESVSLLDEGDYGIGIYASSPIFIAGGPRSSGFSAEGQVRSHHHTRNNSPEPPPGHPSHPSLSASVSSPCFGSADRCSL
jgi:hypothetical protein